MTVLQWVAVGVAAWFVFAVVVSLAFGRMIRRGDAQAARERVQLEAGVGDAMRAQAERLVPDERGRL